MDQDTPQGEHGNIIHSLNRTTSNHNDLTIVVECSDILYQQYEKKFSYDLKAVKVKDLKIMRKELDQPLNFLKVIGANLWKIKIEHRFILIQTEQFMASIDYYLNNRVVVRLGDRQFVMDEEKSKTRKYSELVRESEGVQWRRTIKRDDEELTFGEIMEHLFTMTIRDFSQLSYKGQEFSRDLYNQINIQLIRDI